MNENNTTVDSSSDELADEPEGPAPPKSKPTGPAPSASETTLRILIADEQSTLTVDEAQLRAAIERVLRDSPYDSGAISIAVVDDPTIHEINRQYLEHDYPTDVLSFPLEDEPPYLEGELVVSTDTATSNAAEYDWSAQNELVLYVIHGTLHLIGYHDKQPADIAEMRAAEAKYLLELGIALPAGKSRWSEVSTDETTSEEVSPS